ncbi:MAG TPA: hypothetical protein VH761_13765 [Ilumatobacteraceae bacterium]
MQIHKATLLREHAAGFALGMAGLTWLTSAAAFTVAEDVGVNGRIHSFFDALWWSRAHCWHPLQESRMPGVRPC